MEKKLELLGRALDANAMIIRAAMRLRDDAPPRKDPAREQRKSATLREMPRERTA